MNNMVQFPRKTVRDSALIEKCIKDVLGQTQADDETKNEITNRALHIWNKYQHEFQPISYHIPDYSDCQKYVPFPNEG